MEEELILFKTAKLAKEKEFGYDFGGTEYVPSFYCEENNLKTLRESEMQIEDARRQDNYLRPTQSLLQKWLRDTHNIHIEIKPVPFGQDCFKWIYKIGLMEIINLENLSRKNYYSILAKQNEKYFDTYEESLEAGLFEVLSLI